MRPFKFQWQKVEDEYVGPGIVSISPQRLNKFSMQINKNVLGSLVIKLMFFVTIAIKDVMNIIYIGFNNLGQS